MPNYDIVPDARDEIPKFDEPLLPSPDPYLRDPVVAREPAVADLPPIEPVIERVPLVPRARADDARGEGPIRYALRSRVDLPGTINDKRYRPSSSGK